MQYKEQIGDNFRDNSSSNMCQDIKTPTPINPHKLLNKLLTLGLGTPLSLWIMDILTNRLQHVRIGHLTSSTITLSTGAPQGYVLSPVLYSLFKHDCTLFKFADDTTIKDLITGNNGAAYRMEVQRQ